MQRILAWSRIWLAVGLVTVVAAVWRMYPQDKMTVDHARQAVVKEDRHVMCEAIAAYTEDVGRSSETLERLLDSGYIHCVPKLPTPRILPHGKAERGADA